MSRLRLQKAMNSATKNVMIQCLQERSTLRCETQKIAPRFIEFLLSFLEIRHSYSEQTFRINQRTGCCC